MALRNVTNLQSRGSEHDDLQRILLELHRTLFCYPVFSQVFLSNTDFNHFRSVFAFRFGRFTTSCSLPKTHAFQVETTTVPSSYIMYIVQSYTVRFISYAASPFNHDRQVVVAHRGDLDPPHSWHQSLNHVQLRQIRRVEVLSPSPGVRVVSFPLLHSHK